MAQFFGQDGLHRPLLGDLQPVGIQVDGARGHRIGAQGAVHGVSRQQLQRWQG
jgi:hypothetical protein